MAGQSREIVLHIGRAKTGTSQLQATLAKSEIGLAEQGWLYPVEARAGNSHREVARFFGNRKNTDAGTRARYADGVEALAAHLRVTDQNVILSGEGFQNVRRPENVGSAIPPERTNVVVYLREQYAWAQSAYCQAVQTKRLTLDFGAYLAGTNPRYEELISRWRDQFGARRVTPRVYDRAFLSRGDIVEDFCEVIGLERAPLAEAKQDSNPSIGGGLLELKRRLNALHGSEVFGEKAAYRAFNAVARNHAAMRAKPGASAEAIAQFRGRFIDENRRIDARYFSATQSLTVAAATAVESADVATSEVSDAWSLLTVENPIVAEQIADLVHSQARAGSPDAVALSQIVLR